MPEITLDDIVAEVRNIATEQPHRVYVPTSIGDCQYGVGPANPHGCIIGYALRRLGRPIDNEDGDISDLFAPDGPLNDIAPATRRPVQWLAEVQSEQDDRLPWGEAVATADEKMPDMAP